MCVCVGVGVGGWVGGCMCGWGGGEGVTPWTIYLTHFTQDLMFTSANRVGHCSHCSHNFTESTSVY